LPFNGSFTRTFTTRLVTRWITVIPADVIVIFAGSGVGVWRRAGRQAFSLHAAQQGPRSSSPEAGMKLSDLHRPSSETLGDHPTSKLAMMRRPSILFISVCFDDG
jgi:hypothetical protein